MTRPNLVLDGEQVRIRLQAERLESRTPVHVDWVRFTVLRRNVPLVHEDRLYQAAEGDAVRYELLREFHAELRRVPDCDVGPAAEAMELAEEVAQALGSEFAVCQVVKKGHDFYRHRYSIERCGTEVGWVGFGSSSDSPRQAAQAKTLHCNVYGSACTFAAPGWTERIASIVDERSGTITRVDLALDFFDGLPGGITRIVDDYEAGRLDVLGKRLKANNIGDWTASSKGARSFYVGSKEAGKQTNYYEKGDQLFGVEAGSRWLRAEARLGNKLRDLPSDLLRRPADFFSALSPYHAQLLELADCCEVDPVPIPRRSRLPLETVKAEVTRSVRWFFNVAGPIASLALRELPERELLEVMATPRKPGRLSKFSPAQVRHAVQELFTPDGLRPAVGWR